MTENEKIKTLQIGKEGVTENVLGEIKTQLKNHKKLKLKVLKNFETEKTRTELAHEIATHVNAKVLDVRGNTFILEKI